MRQTNTKDLMKLKGVVTDLQWITTRALWLSPVDFIIVQGLRDDATQWKVYQEGKSQTLDSRHLTGHAVDVAAVVQGKISWDPVFYPVIAKAFAEAAAEAKQAIRWGGNWKQLPWPATTAELRKSLEEYTDFCKAKNRKPFMDLGHMEIPRSST